MILRCALIDVEGVGSLSYLIHDVTDDAVIDTNHIGQKLGGLNYYIIYSMLAVRLESGLLYSSLNKRGSTCD